MKVITVNGKEVIECNHCKGTGICANWEERTIYKDAAFGFVTEDKKVKECGHCGAGTPAIISKYSTSYKATPPICTFCRGEGFKQV